MQGQLHPQFTPEFDGQHYYKVEGNGEVNFALQQAMVKEDRLAN
jgi:hypothetical protein